MKIKIPSKTFLWGEYSALAGGSAGVLTTSPCFEFQFTQTHPESSKLKNSLSLQQLFHPESPAGLFLNKTLSSELSLKSVFYDPHQLKGGFGRSTAEWIAVYVLNILKKNRINFDTLLNFKNELTSEANINEAWLEYQSVFAKKINKPSGYDLLAQFKNLELEINLDKDLDNQPKVFKSKISILEREKLKPAITLNSDWSLKLNVLIFKTQLKVKTHDHLESLSLKNLNDLKILSQKVTEMFLIKNHSGFLNELIHFDQHLKDLSYILPETISLCEKFKKMESVAYARGCGALGADVISVFYSGLHSQGLRQEIEKSLGLYCIADVKGID